MVHQKHSSRNSTERSGGSARYVNGPKSANGIEPVVLPQLNINCGFWARILLMNSMRALHCCPYLLARPRNESRLSSHAQDEYIPSLVSIHERRKKNGKLSLCIRNAAATINWTRHVCSRSTSIDISESSWFICTLHPDNCHGYTQQIKSPNRFYLFIYELL